MCELCEEERECGVEERRALLEGGRYEESQVSVREGKKGAMDDVRSYIEALELTYNPRQGGNARLGKLRPALHAAYHLMAKASWSSSVKEGLKWELAAFKSQGGILNPRIPPCSSSSSSLSPTLDDSPLLASSIYNSTLSTMQLLLCAMRCLQAGRPSQDVMKWVRLALDNERILAGGVEAGKKLWEVQYGEIVERMGLAGVVREPSLEE